MSIITLFPLFTFFKHNLCFKHRADEDGRKEFKERGFDREREREREKERRQKEKERLRRQDEDRRRRRERQDGENSYKKKEEEVRKEKERVLERKKGENGDSERTERPAKDKKDESGKRERLRNKVIAKSDNLFQKAVCIVFNSYFSALGPACYSAVPTRSQKPQQACRRRRIQLCQQKARY